MSVSIMWVVSAIDASAVQRWGPVWTELFDGHASREDLRDKWRSWLDDPQPNASFAELFSAAANGGSKQLYHFLDDCASEDLTDVHVTRRLPATEALFHAIGPARARLLPGFLGNFVLSPSQLAAVLPDIQAAFTFPQDERNQAHARMDEALADSASLDPTDVLDTLPRRAQFAADRAMGLTSVSQAIV